MMSTEASRPIRDGDEWGRGKSEDSRQAPTRKTNKAAVDRRQNNKMLRQCPSGIAQRPPHHAIAVPTAMWNSHKDNRRKRRKKRRRKRVHLQDAL